nr:MAG TPA: hypothetical protein [Caudoviricetes sp.]
MFCHVKSPPYQYYNTKSKKNNIFCEKMHI